MLLLFFYPGCCCLILKTIMNLTQNIIKSIAWHSLVLKKFRWAPPQCTKHMMVLSKLLPFFEKWMNPNIFIIHKVMPLKITILCWQQMALYLRKRHDGNWWCSCWDQSLPCQECCMCVYHPPLTVVRRCDKYPPYPTPLYVWLHP